MDEVLRGPTPPPRVPEPFVGRDAEVRELAEQLRYWERPPDDPSSWAVPVLLLHGPSGVGKSALAAAVVRHTFAPAESDPQHVHWLSPGPATSAEAVLLRLLAEHRAPRRQILTAALDAERSSNPHAFTELLRDQCREHIRGSVVVLDGIRPPVGRAVLEALDGGSNLVVVTSRQHARWTGLITHAHEVRPLKARDAVALVRATAGDTGPDKAGLARQLASAARGLPVWLRVAGAALTGLDPQLPVAATAPEDLFMLASDRLGPETGDALLRLAARGGDGVPFTSHSVTGLLPTHVEPDAVPHILSSLESAALLHSAPDGTLSLPARIAAAALHGMRAEDRDLLAARVAADLEGTAANSAWYTARSLDGRTDSSGPRTAHLPPSELARHIDEFMDITGGPGPLLGQRGELADALATVLAAGGDAHRLVALYRASGEAVYRALGHLLRDVGMVEQAEILLRLSPHWPDLPTSVETAYCSGELASVLASLEDSSAPEEGDAARLATLRGAALCDQGRPLEAQRELADALETHHRAGCARGRGWTLLHGARVSLSLSRDYPAEHLLGQAAQVLRGVGDTRGLNWVATERIRLLLLRDDAVAALDAAQRALTAHESAEDLRGMGWTCHHLGLTHARLGNPENARVALQAASRHFETCGDLLGRAWTRHRLALLTADTGPLELAVGAEEFDALGCSVGQAWSLVEQVLRSPRQLRSTSQLTLWTAENIFRDLGDQGGLTWARAVRNLDDGQGGSAVPEAPAGINGREQLARDLTAFGRSAAKGERPVIPLHARDTIGAPNPHRTKPLAPYIADGAGLSPLPRCQVRLTLLDDSPSAHATARILLRVVPAEGHPWSRAGDEVPWLTAVAVPLTPASVEPPTALLRPSEQEVHGAEFDVTAARPGVHVIRFTIALERTGTVLQQVETELDILDTDRQADLAAPHAASPWGR
ncbi:AAA family ATPase [Streptomyces lincolnensis]|uniref:AAA family ATPase n=1 Tax=Streptomyces lincolnensis TaxID=1915 RepID=UPI0037CDC9E4